MRFSWALAFGLLFPAVAAAYLEHGSVLIVAYSPSEIVMAADSRGTNVKTGQFRDDYCKPVRRFRVARSIGSFDSVGLLRRRGAYDSERRGGFVQQVATRGVDDMEQNYAKLPADLVRQFSAIK